MKPGEQGMALVVVLGVISVLLAAGLHLAKITHESVHTAGQQTDRFEAREMALSAIHLAMALLAEDAAGNDSDSIQENWADPQFLTQMADQLGYTRGRISLEIVDELGKIQVNALLTQFPGHAVNPVQVQLWERLLDRHIPQERSRDTPDAAAVINALIDWLDAGDDHAVTGLSGAESDYYQGLSPPYACADGVVNHVLELLNVKGFTPELFLPGGEDPDHRNGAATAPVMAWTDLFTVYGISDLKEGEKTYHYPGRININTAGIEVLRAMLPLGMEEFAQDLLDYRAQKSEDGDVFINSLDKGWYSRVISLSETEQQRFDRMIRYDSNLFKATATVRLNRAHVHMSAYIQRERQAQTNQWICRIRQMEGS
jgi:general secretion pathway protein K